MKDDPENVTAYVTVPDMNAAFLAVLERIERVTAGQTLIDEIPLYDWLDDSVEGWNICAGRSTMRST